MAQIARYGAFALTGVNKTSDLKPDETGYYRIILGGFEMASHSGVYYPLTAEVKALFAPGGIVRRRLDGGYCRGEYGHPNLIGMNLQQILQRLPIIMEDKISHHIKSVELHETKDENGKQIVLVIGMVKPTGAMGPALEGQFANPEENVAFSIRSLTKPTIHNGKPAKIVTDAITWDYVNEPGITAANAFNTTVIGDNLKNAMALESIRDDIIFTDKDLELAINASYTCGLEADASRLTMVRDALGWNKVQVTNLSAIHWR